MRFYQQKQKHVFTRQGWRLGGLSSSERPSSERNKKKSFTLNFKMTEVSGLVQRGLEASMHTYFAGSEFYEPNMHKFFFFYAYLWMVWR